MIRDAQLTSETRLNNKGWALWRLSWLATLALIVALFVAGQWFLYQELQLPCGGVACQGDDFYLTASEIADMLASGYAPNFYAAAQVVLYVVFFLIHAVIATLIFWARPEDRMARFVAFALLIWSGTFPSVPHLLWEWAPALAWLMSLGETAGGLCFYLFLFIFPNGQFAPRWMRWVAVLMVAWAAVGTILSTPALSSTGLATVENQIWPVFLPFFVIAAIGTQVYRYRRLSNQLERQQSRWVLFGIIAGLSWILLLVFYANFFNPAILQGALNKTISNGLIYVGFLMVPLSIGIAILRARLWDIDLLISRTLVYGALTASVVGMYVLVVGYLGTLLQTSGNLLVSLVATGVVALLFQPLRERLQRGVNRLIYGERDEPYAALARLGQRLEATLAPEAVLPTIVETIAHALKLPYVAIALTTNDEGRRTNDEHYTIVAEVAVGNPESAAGAAAAPHLPSPISQLPLIYQGETVGQLLLAPRAPGEPFGPADQRLLDDLARQAGVAVHAVRLTSDLQRARERLVAAREEERRRLRRDLHDGLGPQLASQTLLIDTVFRLLPDDIDGAVELLQRLKSQSQGAIADIRRLVYALRPPALDDLGLVEALREQAMQYVQSGVQIAVVAPRALPPLPAAVEVAVYRIAQEALTNVIRHAQARVCTIEIVAGPELTLTIADDGRGLPAERRMGVGLNSMHERATELGGRLTIEPRPGGGTQVRAWLPLAP
jgi:signal transduction histidine kinase